MKNILQISIYNKILAGMALLLSCGFINPLHAQTTTNPDSALLEILEEMDGVPLTLNQAVELALVNATSVRAAESDYLAARSVVRRERGFFDPEIYLGLDYLDSEQPTASFFSGAPVLATQQTTAQAGLRLDLPIGTQLDASLNTIRFKTNSAFAFLNPQYTSVGMLSLRQPLLKGFSTSARKDLSKAEQQLDAMKKRYDQEVLVTTASVEWQYWDLYAAERNYAVQVLLLNQGEAFLRETEQRAKTGLIGPGQVANAKTFLAEQKLGFLDREEELENLSNQLASLIGKRPEGNMPRYMTTDTPPSEYPKANSDDLVQMAMNENFDLKAAQLDVMAVQTMADAAGWEAWPSMDLVASVGGNGLSGTPQDVIFGGDTLLSSRGGGFGDAIKQVGQNTYPNWGVGVEISIPIGLRTGLGERDRLRAEVTRAEQIYIERARLLEEQIRNSHRRLLNGKQRLEAAREGVEAAQEQVRIGRIDFYNGRTTAFELVRLGADFATAQQRYSQALVRTAKAAAILKQLTSGAYPSEKTY
jgi:outer membrane protein